MTISVRTKTIHHLSRSSLLAGLLLGASSLIPQALAQSPPSHELELDTRQTLEPRLTTPSEVTSGSLLFEAKAPGKYISAPALATDVEINISGPIIRTKVTQRFENTSDRWIEGVYVFPLPDESAVDTLRMQIGDRFIEGEIKEREQARKIYEKAKSEGRKTSLLEQERANIFTNNVANIGPGETVIVQIEYQETVKIDDGAFSTRFPMVVAPRYNPPAQVLTASIDASTGWAVSDPVPDRTRITPGYQHPALGVRNPVSLTVNMDAGFPVGDLTSSYHDITAVWDGKTRATASLDTGTTPANRDFELRWTADNGGAPSAALFTEKINDEDYYLIMITPPENEALTQTPAREVVFVIDTSGSMGGQSIRQARQSLILAVDRLGAYDSFNIVEFNSNMNTMFQTPLPATTQNRRAAKNWIAALQATGGTNMLPALTAALKMDTPDDDRLRQIIFLTDGAIGNEQALFETISTGRHDARIFTIGIGSAPNTYFMSRAAELGRGTFTHIGAVHEVAERMNALFGKLETPAITDIDLAWPDGATVDLSHTLVPDVYEGETLVLAAHADTPEGALSVSGISGTQPWRVNLSLDQASERGGVSKLWARKKIAQLELDRARANASPDTLDASILKLALDHSLISRLTSLVAVDVTPSRQEGDTLTRANVPLNLPEGWDFDKVFGPNTGGVSPAHQSSSNAIPAEALREASIADDVPTASKRSVRLPQTATLAEVKLMLGGLLLMLAGLLACMRTRFLP